MVSCRSPARMSMVDFLVISFSLLLKPSTMPAEISPSAANLLPAISPTNSGREAQKENRRGVAYPHAGLGWFSRRAEGKRATLST